MATGTIYDAVGNYPSVMDYQAQRQQLAQNALQQQLLQGQVGNMPLQNQLLQGQVAQGQLGLQKQRQLMDLLGGLANPAQAGAAQAPQGQSALMPPAPQGGMPPQAVPGAAPMAQGPTAHVNGFGNLSFPQVVAIKAMGGPDLTSDFKMALEGVSHAPGSEVTDMNGNVRRVAQLNPGETQAADGTVSNLPGSVESAAARAGAVTGATKQAENAQTPLSPELLRMMPNPRPMTTGQFVATTGAPQVGAPQGGAPQAAPTSLSQLTPGQQQAAAADMAQRGQPLSAMKVNGAPVTGDIQSQLDAAKQGGPAAIQRFVETIRPLLGGDPMKMAGLAYDLHTPIGTPIHAMQAAQGGQAPTAAPAGAPALMSQAQTEAANLAATQAVHADTDPVVALRKNMVTESHTANQKAKDDLADVTNNEGELVARNNRIMPLLDQLPSAGGFAYGDRVSFANNLKNSGLLPQGSLDSLSKWVAGGDPTVAKSVSNQMASAGIQNMLDALNKEGKPNRVMYDALHKEQEGLDNGKDVLQNVMKLQQQLYDQHRSQLGSMTDLMSAPDYNPIKFQSQFATAKAKSIQTPPNTATTKTIDFGSLK